MAASVRRVSRTVLSRVWPPHLSLVSDPSLSSLGCCIQGVARPLQLCLRAKGGRGPSCTLCSVCCTSATDRRVRYVYSRFVVASPAVLPPSQAHVEPKRIVAGVAVCVHRDRRPLGL